jgi:tRNA (guanine37-N1)-methyltransferase
MNIKVLTIFPELIEQFTSNRLFSRAVEQGLLKFEVEQLRDYAVNAHGQIDDTPYGGGSGMILRPDAAIPAIKRAKASNPKLKVIVPSPRGTPLTQPLLQKLTDDTINDGVDYLFLCPRYEGLDQRILDHHVDLEVSLGDYVLMGGEVPVMAMIEGMVRLIPGVLGNAESALSESFENESGLLEYDQYTKPANYEGRDVPEVLTSGNHEAIAKWREVSSIQRTAEHRPDLLAGRRLPDCPVYLALIHYPVLGKDNEIVTSSITNIDLHDIARTSRTYGARGLYIVHPTRIQRSLTEKIAQHWDTGYGSTYNPNRSDALRLVRVVTAIDEMVTQIEQEHGSFPLLVGTSARRGPHATSYENFQKICFSSKRPILLMFGTSWGLASEAMERAEIILEPIEGATDYNHLSVRSAAAIIMDRVLGKSS